MMAVVARLALFAAVGIVFATAALVRSRFVADGAVGGSHGVVILVSNAG
jgi:hypothetical protein